MYNRYVRDDRGSYTRVTTEASSPRHAQSSPPPDGAKPASGAKPAGERPTPPHRPSPPVPPAGKKERPPENGFLGGLLDQLHLGDIDSGDLLLLALLFFLFRQKADEELLIALGLLLIL